MREVSLPPSPSKNELQSYIERALALNRRHHCLSLLIWITESSWHIKNLSSDTFTFEVSIFRTKMREGIY